MQPKVLICENVKGLTMEYAKEHLQRMVNDFEYIYVIQLFINMVKDTNKVFHRN